jgi:hypothetical protein
MVLRSRYRLNMRVPLNNNTTTDNTFFTDVRAEAFIPHRESIDESFASTYRLGLVIGYNKDKKWRYQIIGYMDRGKNTMDDTPEASRYILEAKAQMSL